MVIPENCLINARETWLNKDSRWTTLNNLLALLCQMSNESYNEWSKFWNFKVWKHKAQNLKTWEKKLCKLNEKRELGDKKKVVYSINSSVGAYNARCIGEKEC